MAKSSLELSGELAREGKGQGTKGPGSELADSLYGPFWRTVTHTVTGHAKLRRRVLRRRGCMMPVQCRHGCYVVKQHYLWCVRAGESELSHSNARSKNWPLFA